MIIEFLSTIIQLGLFLVGIYYFAVAIFSLTVVKRRALRITKHTYALLVAAHNEETVISDLVDSLKALDYPAEKFDIFVVADNCTDKTAELAKMHGAKVLRRTNPQKRGKGYAMEFAFEHIFALDTEYEYICVFDADNIVKKNFLAEINDKINEGYEAVQGYIDSKNPSANWLAFSYSLWYWINNRVSQLSRGNLDLGCRLGGTGFAVSTELIKKYGWGATCLAEDTEFTLKMAINDLKVGWAHGAVVYDEKPRQLGTSINQRQRWMQGLSEVAVRYVKPLAKKCVDEKSVFAFHTLMNFWGDMLYPATVIFFWTIYILSFVLSKDSFFYGVLCSMWDSPWMMLLLSVLNWGNLFITIAGLYNDGRLNRSIMKNMLGFLVYILSWIPIGIMGILKRENKEWYHTPHSGKDNDSSL